MSLYDRIVTYERSLRAARSGSDCHAAVMAVMLEMTAAQWAFDAGMAKPGSPYAFSPEEVFQAAQRLRLTPAAVANLLDRYGMDAVTRIVSVAS
jgi:hypothetical protein